MWTDTSGNYSIGDYILNKTSYLYLPRTSSVYEYLHVTVIKIFNSKK